MNFNELALNKNFNTCIGKKDGTVEFYFLRTRRNQNGAVNRPYT